jgi:hypothetical protein
MSAALHPAENRGYRELYAYTRQAADHWPGLAERIGGSAAGPLHQGGEVALELIEALEATTPGYDLYSKPAAQSVGANLARTRQGVRDRFLERNQALRFALADVQHLVTLLGYLEYIARHRGDDTLRGFCSEWRGRLMPVERNVRAAAMELGSNPNSAIEPLDDSAIGKAAHGVQYVAGSIGEWLDRRSSNKG